MGSALTANEAQGSQLTPAPLDSSPVGGLGPGDWAVVQVVGHRVSPAIWGNAEVSGPNCWCLFSERCELLLLYSQLMTLLTTSWASRNLP